MLDRFERNSALIAGPLTVALWVSGLIVGQGLPDVAISLTRPPTHRS
jgi:hypothetical protein